MAHCKASGPPHPPPCSDTLKVIAASNLLLTCTSSLNMRCTCAMCLSTSYSAHRASSSCRPARKRAMHGKTLVASVSWRRRSSLCDGRSSRFEGLFEAVVLAPRIREQTKHRRDCSMICKSVCEATHGSVRYRHATILPVVLHPLAVARPRRLPTQSVRPERCSCSRCIHTHFAAGLICRACVLYARVLYACRSSQSISVRMT